MAWRGVASSTRWAVGGRARRRASGRGGWFSQLYTSGGLRRVQCGCRAGGLSLLWAGALDGRVGFASPAAVSPGRWH